MTLEEQELLEQGEIEVINHIQDQIDTLQGYELDEVHGEGLVLVSEFYELDEATDMALDDIYDLDMSRTKLPPKVNMKVVAVVDPKTKRKAWKYVRTGGVTRRTSAEKIAIQKAQRKSNTAGAKRKRERTLRLKKMLGI